MLLIPAIDLREGKCVRLVEGKIENETVYSHEPVEQALKWQEKGAKMLHLVDLDGAFAGRPKNLDVIKEIIQAVDIPVQLGGGIRTLETIEMLLDSGVNRVILGSIAIYKPELVREACQRYGERVIAGIDAKDGLVAIEGWESTVDKTTIDLALEMKEAGIQRIVFTDTRRDGTLKGPNVESTRELAEQTGLKIVASGGVSSLQDILKLKECKEAGVDSIILGKALYTGAVDLEEALKLV